MTWELALLPGHPLRGPQDSSAVHDVDGFPNGAVSWLSLSNYNDHAY